MNRLPTPGATALQVRKICRELDEAVAVLGCRGIADYAAIDVAGSEFLLSIVSWEIAEESSKPFRWVHILAAYNDVLGAVREAAQRRVLERDGEA